MCRLASPLIAQRIGGETAVCFQSQHWGEGGIGGIINV